MTKVETKILIPQKIETVWEALIDPDLFPKWNHQIENLKGTFHLNSQIIVDMHLHDNPNKKYTFKAKITDFEKNRKLGWKGGIPSFLYGCHYWELKSAGDETLLIQVEKWSGLFTFFMNKTTLGSIKQAYDESNISFKNYIANLY